MERRGNCGDRVFRLTDAVAMQAPIVGTSAAASHIRLRPRIIFVISAQLYIDPSHLTNSLWPKPIALNHQLLNLMALSDNAALFQSATRTRGFDHIFSNDVTTAEAHFIGKDDLFHLLSLGVCVFLKATLGMEVCLSLLFPFSPTCVSYVFPY